MRTHIWARRETMPADLAEYECTLCNCRVNFICFTI